MRKTTISTLVVVVGLMLYSCGATVEDGATTHSQQENTLASIFSDYGLLNANIGDSLIMVKKKLGAPSAVQDEELSYPGQLNGMDRTLYANFDQGRLYEITLDIFPSDSTALKATFDELKEIMDERFQSSNPAPGYITWKTGSANGRLIEVTLSDESLEYEAPLLMLNFMENYDRTFNAN